ncbi:MAG: glycosyl transferase [Odoribacter sp.]|nr:glycosyl transferase [Odoribacter sp.]
MRLLVIRTSAMGDVALVTPVLSEMKRRYPDVEIVMLTRPAFKSFFNRVEGFSIISPDFKKRHKGFHGLFRLYRDIQKQSQIDYVIDLHDVIRSKVLRFFFRTGGVPVSVIEKGRREKRELINGKRKDQLKHSVIRYCDAFGAAGFTLEPSTSLNIVPDAQTLIKTGEILNRRTALKIGVAPYARHKLKVWPEEKMISLLNMIAEKKDADFFLFGGKDESDQLDLFKEKVKGSVNLAGTLSLEEQLAVMSELDFMIAMDSSNMHMAALVGTKVVSVWGGTDPLNGFGAWMQPSEYSIRIPVDELTCRPCTIFGKGECRRGDLACLNWLTPEKVFAKLTGAKLI